MPLPPCPPTPGSAAISSPCRHGQRRQAQEHQRGANRGQGVEDAAAAVRDEAVAKRAARRQPPRRWLPAKTTARPWRRHAEAGCTVRGWDEAGVGGDVRGVG